jgi:ribulose-5-phosphate 4-epimerase/fuculose-1-phosphate aldolase
VPAAGEIATLSEVWRLLGKLGLVDGAFNHISLSFGLDGVSPMLAINPAGYHASKTSADAFRLLPLRNYTDEEALDRGVNPDGLRLHTDLHLARGRNGCAVHLHAPYSIAVGATEEGLLPLSQIAMEFTEQLLLVEYEGLARGGISDPGLCEFAKRGGEALLRNHGLLVMADSPAEAFYAAYYLETACRLQVLTLAQGLALHLPTKEVVAEAGRALRSDRKEAAAATLNALRSWARMEGVDHDEPI